MKVRYQIFKGLNLEVHQFIGDWSTRVYEKFLQELIREPDFILVGKVLIDFRDVNMKPAVSELNHLIDFRDHSIQKRHLTVHLVNSPMATVLSHLYQEGLNQRGYNYSYCSTLEHALNLLELDIPANEMDDMLKNLTNQTE